MLQCLIKLCRYGHHRPLFIAILRSPELQCLIKLCRYGHRKNKYKSEHIVYVFFDNAESVANEQKENPNCSRYEPITMISPKNRVLYIRFVGEHLSDRKKLNL
jgi:hypothetical protein